MSRKKIVIISRTIYPMQFPRSMRATELAKEFSRQGHEVILYAVLGSYNYSTFEAKNNLKINNIGKMRFAKMNSDGPQKPTFLSKVLNKLFNKVIEFPDIELMFKIPKILKREKNVDLLISVAVPYPLHWGVARYKQKHPNSFPKTWVADCGDPYMGNKFNKHPFYFEYIEKWFCKLTDYISIPIEEARNAYYKEFHEKIKIIPQGFNFSEFELKDKSKNNQKLTFLYAGAFYKGIRDPQMFLEYLCSVEVPFTFIIYTKNVSLLDPYLDRLKGKLEIRDYIPRKELLQVMCEVDFVVNFENGTSVQSPSKLIDYALVKKPILSIASLKLDEEAINQFLNKDYKNKLIVGNIDKYNIVTIVEEFSKLINE